MRQTFFVVLIGLFFLPSCAKKKELIGPLNKKMANTMSSTLGDQGSSAFTQLSVDEIRTMKNNNEKRLPEGNSFSVDRVEVNQTVHKMSVREYEAKRSDIPISFDLIPDLDGVCEDTRTVMLPYHSYLTRDSISLFYCVEMERYGWIKQICFEGCETVLVFAKPKKTAIIIIRSVDTHGWRRSTEHTEVKLYIEK